MPSMTTRHFLQTGTTWLAGLLLAACGKQEPPAPSASVQANNSMQAGSLFRSAQSMRAISTTVSLGAISS